MIQETSQHREIRSGKLQDHFGCLSWVPLYIPQHLELGMMGAVEDRPLSPVAGNQPDPLKQTEPLTIAGSSAKAAHDAAAEEKAFDEVSFIEVEC